MLLANFTKKLLLVLVIFSFFQLILITSHNITYAADEGTFVIRAKLKGPAGERFIRDDEKQYFYYDIYRVVGRGPSTQTTAVLTNIQPNQVFSLPANDPSKRDEYVIQIKQMPGWQYSAYPFEYERRGGAFDFPYTFTIKAGEQTEVIIPYGVNILMISLLKNNGRPELAPVGLKFEADIVDYRGDFVRNLTPSEAAQVSFEVEKSNCADSGFARGGTPGSFDGCGKKPAPDFPSPAKLGDYSHIPIPMTTHDLLRILNVVPPEGYVLRSISEKNEVEIGFTQDFGGNGGSMLAIDYYRNANCVPHDVWNLYSDILGPSPCLEKPIITAKLHFTKLGESRFQKKDAAPFLAENDSGLDFVKRIVQTYSDKEALYTEHHSDFRSFKNVEGTRDFPAQVKIAHFNGKPYLFINTGSKIQIYDITEPTDPKLVENFKAPHTIEPRLNDREVAMRLHNRIAYPWPMVTQMFVKDNYPYILVNLNLVGESGIVGAILRLNPQTMKLAVDEKLKLYVYPYSYGDTKEFKGFYTGKDGQTYIVGPLTCQSKLVNTYSSILIMSPPEGSFSYCGNLAIYRLNDQGTEISVAKVLYHNPKNSADINSVIPDLSSWNTRIHLFSVGEKTYLFISGHSDKKLRIIDITEPTNLSPNSVFLADGLGNSFLNYVVDEEKKKLYVTPGIKYAGVSTFKVEVFDLSKLPASLPKIKEFSNIFEMAGISEQSSVIVELKKRLNIPSSQNIFVKDNELPFLALSPTFSIKNDILILSDLGRRLKLHFGDRGNPDNIEYSDYATPLIQLVVDGKNNFESPEVLGVILGRQILKMAGGINSVEGDCFYFAEPILPILYRNRYLYRANCRIADVWEFKNRQPSPEQSTEGKEITTEINQLKREIEEKINLLKRKGYDTTYLEQFYMRFLYNF